MGICGIIRLKGEMVAEIIRMTPCVRYPYLACAGRGCPLYDFSLILDNELEKNGITIGAYTELSQEVKKDLISKLHESLQGTHGDHPCLNDQTK